MSSLNLIKQSVFKLESGNGNVDGQTNGEKDRQKNGWNYTNFERNLAMMVIYLPVKFEFVWKRFRVRKRKCGQTDRQTDRRTDVGHINLIGGLVTCNPPKNVTKDVLKCWNFHTLGGSTSLLTALGNWWPYIYAWIEHVFILDREVSFKRNSMSLDLLLLEKKLFMKTCTSIWTPHSDAIMLT